MDGLIPWDIIVIIYYWLLLIIYWSSYINYHME
jgi:hypothetical protein